MLRALAALLLCAIAGRAQDLGDPVLFDGAAVVLRPSALKSGAEETGPSDPLPRPFDSVILQGSLPDPASRLQGSRDSGSGWEPWIDARLSRFPSGRFWGRVDFPSVSPGRVRLRVLGAGAPGSLTVYSIEGFVRGTGEAPASAGRSGRRPKAGAPPPVIPREDWRARAPREAFTEHHPERISQHHTAGRRPLTLAESLEEVRFIQDFHQNGRGWNDIGYHFLIDAAGRVFEGRPETVVGAHVRGRNTGNVGISLMGFHHPPHSHPVSAEQLAAVRALGRTLLDRYGFAPEAFLGHRDQGSTACPGDTVYPLLEPIRESWRNPAPEDRVPTELPPAAARRARSPSFDGGR